MLKVCTVEASLLFSLLITRSPQLNMLLSYQIVLGTGAQSVTADRDTRRSDNSNKDKAVRQQDIIKN